uniref:GTP cyclohydrolase I feedback regulator n=30 Tax=Amniota TaxID=32524 RepID=A0A087WTI4_HUMAN
MPYLLISTQIRML